MHGGKVFGIGLSRTGTKSLAAALNRLGIHTRWYPQDPRTYRELARGEFRLSILEEYDGLTDTPVVPYFAQLDALYPGSKFILTIRDMESWLKSCEKHWASSGPTGPQRDDAPHWRKFAFFIDCCVYGCFGFNAERFAYVYDTHVANVQRYFGMRSADLLVLNVCAGEGWERLCPFLDCEIPDEPFPKVTDFQSPLLG